MEGAEAREVFYSLQQESRLIRVGSSIIEDARSDIGILTYTRRILVTLETRWFVIDVSDGHLNRASSCVNKQ